MGMLLDPEFWARLASIVIIDLSLAGDNALVIALAVRSLPRREQWLGRIWGTAAAVALRLLFIAVVSALLTIPLLRVIGGLLLLWVAVKLVRPGGHEEGDVRHGASLRQAVWIIVVADVTMSLDNVLAVAAAAHGDLILVAVGIMLSLPIVVWGSGFLARLMARYAWIIWVGGGILGYVAGEMIMEDPVVRSWLGEHAETVDDVLSLILAAALTLLGWWLARAATPGPPARREA
ncbi:MAG TPA: TerC family protein [Methylomirabilota bacterium]|nr:TerC family protein [Methylomirabilota bacterium]